MPFIIPYGALYCVQAMHCKGIRCNTEAELPEKMAEFLNYNGNANKLR